MTPHNFKPAPVLAETKGRTTNTGRWQSYSTLRIFIFCSHIITCEDSNCLYSKSADEECCESVVRTANSLPKDLMQSEAHLKCT